MAVGSTLVLSDIHFDPLADPAIFQQLLTTPAAQWLSVFAHSRQTSLARSPSDTNYPLLKSTLEAAAAQAPFDFVVVCGDYLRHNFDRAFVAAGGSPSQFPTFATKTALFVVETIQSAFQVPVYLALGNEDSICGDYHMAPGGIFLGALADSLLVLGRHSEASNCFRTAGFYELPHPTLANQEILVLNSVLWSPFYSDCESPNGDSGTLEMKWLGSKLDEAKNLGRKVVLVMHIPPGFDAYQNSRSSDCRSVTPFWRDIFIRQFLDLMQRDGDAVEVVLAGHTHMDDFRVLGSGAHGVAVRITPAVSPVFGNNPAFSLLQYNLKSGAVSDIATYYLDLASGGNDPRWALEYRFSDAYGYPELTSASLGALAERIRDDPKVRQRFAGYFAASAPSPLTPATWLFYSCAENHFSVTDYRDCACAPQSAHLSTENR